MYRSDLHSWLLLLPTAGSGPDAVSSKLPAWMQQSFVPIQARGG